MHNSKAGKHDKITNFVNIKIQGLCSFIMNRVDEKFYAFEY